LLCRADEVDPEVFLEDVRLSLPVARIADESAVVGQAASEQRESFSSDSLQLFWAGVPPAEDSPERSLLDELAKRGLLTEPFDRAATGLTEVYGNPAVVD
jgi:hypothetical protein